MSDTFRDFLKKVRPIQFKEPLAETLGAFKVKDMLLGKKEIDKWLKLEERGN